MRHRVAGRHLGRDAGHRKALFRNLVRELYIHERIITTEAKARSIRGEAEKLITKAKRALADGGNRVHAQRLVNAYLNDKAVSKKVFDVLAPRYTNRPGGYTRIVKIGKRQGDAADMAIIELVEGEQAAS
ncbi:MAG TPA: 50S ribosomal protein L17 [Caldilineaceae bacterium]|nr:50S ribosomal protein L17 [Caldilineaceae bacterium]